MKALLLILAFLATGLLAGFVLRSGHRPEPEAPQAKENPAPAIRITLNSGKPEEKPKQNEDREQ